MKKLMLLIIILMINISVLATSGSIKQDSIIYCNGQYYGSHGNPIHFHEVEKKDGTWVIISEKETNPSCYVKKNNTKETVTFSKCIDGDTAKFIINDKEVTVRFLAVNAPELEHKDQNIEEEPYAIEASEFTCKELKKAKEITLEYDQNSDKEDKYGRVLAFVFVDNNLLQKKLIKKGYAKVDYIYGDYSYVDELKKEEEKAKINKIGIWSNDIYLKNKSTNTEDDIDEALSIVNKIFNFIVDLIKKIIALF